MKISTKGRYALQIMVDLALHDGDGFVPLKCISERRHIGVIKYLEQIITVLQRAGFVKSLRGNSGGYKLARLPEEYAVGEILRAAEGSLAPITCLEDNANQCPRKDKCATLAFWEGYQKAVNDYIDGITLFDLIKGKSPAGDDYCIEDSEDDFCLYVKRK